MEKRKTYFDTPGFITKKVGMVLIFVVGWVTFQAWKFMKNVRGGEVFSYKNISLLKRMAYAFAGFWLFSEIYFHVIYHVLAKNLVFENLRLTKDIPNYGGILFIALFTWVLAHIFKTGLELKKETELTI